MELATEQVSLGQYIFDDLEYWMTNLPRRLKGIPLIYLAIPGSHDSTTYAITNKSKIAPDAEPVIQYLKFLGPLVRKIVSKWSRTQAFSVTQQLKSGIRYFDFRIATREDCDDLYFVHGLYSVPVTEVLKEIRAFLDSHPKEVVILDCNHFYAFKMNDHHNLMGLITSTFQKRLMPYTSHMVQLTLEYLTQLSNYQVIALYRSDAARFTQPLLWPSMCFPTPWPRTVNASTLIERLDHGLKMRDNSVGYISQCVLTPTTWFVIKNIYSSLKKKGVIPLEKQKYFWLKKQRPGYGGINIVICDFIDLPDCQFPKEVVNLNARLLESPAKMHLKSTTAVTPVD